MASSVLKRARVARHRYRFPLKFHRKLTTEVQLISNFLSRKKKKIRLFYKVIYGGNVKNIRGNFCKRNQRLDVKNSRKV